MFAVKRTPRWPDPRVKPPFGSSEINREHALAPSWCWLFNEASGSTLLDMGGLLNAGLTGSYTWGPSARGLSIDFDGASAYAPLTAPGGTFTEASLVMWLRLRNALPGVVSKTGLSNFANAASITHYPYTDANLYVGVLADTRFSLGNNAAFDKSQWHQLAVTARVGGTNWHLYQNAQLFGAGQSIASISFGATTNIGRSGSVTWLDGQIALVTLYQRKLSQTEVGVLYDNPYTFLRPLLRRRYFVPSAAVTIGAPFASGRPIFKVLKSRWG